jgi:hypothetical protein
MKKVWKALNSQTVFILANSAANTVICGLIHFDTEKRLFDTVF